MQRLAGHMPYEGNMEMLNLLFYSSFMKTDGEGMLVPRCNANHGKCHVSRSLIMPLPLPLSDKKTTAKLWDLDGNLWTYDAVKTRGILRTSIVRSMRIENRRNCKTTGDLGQIPSTLISIGEPLDKDKMFELPLRKHMAIWGSSIGATGDSSILLWVYTSTSSRI